MERQPQRCWEIRAFTFTVPAGLALSTELYSQRQLATFTAWAPWLQVMEGANSRRHPGPVKIWPLFPTPGNCHRWQKHYISMLHSNSLVPVLFVLAFRWQQNTCKISKYLRYNLKVQAERNLRDETFQSCHNKLKLFILLLSCKQIHPNWHIPGKCLNWSGGPGGRCIFQQETGCLERCLIGSNGIFNRPVLFHLFRGVLGDIKSNFAPYLKGSVFEMNVKA